MLEMTGALEVDADRFVRAFVHDLVVEDVAFVLQDAGDFALQLGGGHIHFLMLGAHRIAEPHQHIGDGIGDHLARSFYQLAFVTPGTSPARLNWRKHRRHSWNLRM